MSVDIRSTDRRRYMNELQVREKEIAAGLLKASQPASPKALQESEKRIRREIANSNERRRMQCINAGFSNLRALIPQLEGEKLSKAAILQHATEYITSMEKDKARLQVQLEHTKRMLSELGQDRIVTDAYESSSPPPSKRKKRDTESSDEGVGSLSDASDEGGSDIHHENVLLRHQLETERQRCTSLEESIRLLESRLLTLLQGQGSHSNKFRDLHPADFNHHHHLQPQETLFNKVVETVSHEVLVQPPRGEGLQHLWPLSPKVEQEMSMETSLPFDATIKKSDDDSVRFCAQPESLSTLKLEIIPIRESNTPCVVPFVSSAEIATVTANTTAITTADQQNSHPHNYCHRDHPRRRHRQQAQLEQQRAEEEQLRLQKQQEFVVAASPLYRPKHNTQNLENLVEAIRQIEGDRILCGERKLCEERHSAYNNHHQSIPNPEESERETSSVSDQDELKSESSGRDSPLRQHHHHQINITSNPQTSSMTVSPKNSNSSNFSDKYPIATHLLHSPLQMSYFRPAVIVHKQGTPADII